MSQGTLDLTSPRPGKAHRHASPAERAAALAVTPRSGTQRFKCLQAIAASGIGGCSQWDVVEKTGLLRSSVCARFNELEEGGFVERTGQVRKSPMGSLESLYRATRLGMEAVR